MTLDDAKKVGAIVGTADNGCSVCVDNLIQRLNVTFPQFVWERGAMLDVVEDDDGDITSPSRYAIEVIER